VLPAGVDDIVFLMTDPSQAPSGSHENPESTSGNAEAFSPPLIGSPAGRQKRLGEILIDEGIISPEDLDRALQQQKRKLGEILVEIGACRAEDLDRAIQIQRLGRTRADRYLGYLRVALLAILMLVLGLTTTLLKLRDQSQFLLRIESEALTLEEVRNILGDDQATYKLDAMRSLTRFLDKAEINPILQSAFRSDQWYVRTYAIHLARRSNNPGHAEALTDLLNDPDEFVRGMAYEALKELLGTDRGRSFRAWSDYIGKSPPQAGTVPSAGIAPATESPGGTPP